MASSLDFINYVCEQLVSCGDITYKKMFGEYMVYCNCKPLILICEDTAFVKINEVTERLLSNSDTGVPYNGAKPHYILDVDNTELLNTVITELEKVTLTPKPKKKAK